MVIATVYRAMAAEHHRLACMCRSPEFREQHSRLETGIRALAEKRVPRDASDPESSNSAVASRARIAAGRECANKCDCTV